jgi:hypothetical protein
MASKTLMGIGQKLTLNNTSNNILEERESENLRIERELISREERSGCCLGCFCKLCQHIFYRSILRVK